MVRAVPFEVPDCRRERRPDLGAGGSPRASGDDDSTGAARGAAGRESGPLGRIERLAPRRAVAVPGIDGQRAARCARVSDDEAGGRASFVALVAGVLPSVIVSVHAPGEPPRGLAAGDAPEHDRPEGILGERGKGGARERDRQGKNAKSLHDVPTFASRRRDLRRRQADHIPSGAAGQVHGARAAPGTRQFRYPLASCRRDGAHRGRGRRPWAVLEGPDPTC